MNKEISVPVLKTPDDKNELAQVLPREQAMKTISESTEIFQLMESRDEDQMMKEVMGVFSKEYVYDIPFKGGNSSKCSTPGCGFANKTNHTHVRGLSWSGVKEARRIFKAIDTREVSKPVIINHDGKQFYECKVTAVDLRTGNVTTTYKRHPLMKARRDGSLMEDPYAFEVVQSKAKRNAISELLPQPLVRGWIGDWVKGKKDFDPQRAVDLKEGEDYQVQEESKKRAPSKTRHQTKSENNTSRAKLKEEPHLAKILLDKVNATLKEFEIKGDITAQEATKQYCAHFKIKYLYYLTTDQANQIIKALNARIANIASSTNEEAKDQTPDSTDTLPTSKTKAQNIQAIKDKLVELGWDLEDPKLVSSLLKAYGLASLEDLDKADDILVEEILDKVANAK